MPLLSDAGRGPRQRVGVPREKVDARPVYATGPLFSNLERRGLCYARAMTRNVTVDGSLVGELSRHLFAEALVQLTLRIAAARFTNRLNEALGTELES